MPTIRVDNEVYGWLQEQARPFEDTPNSVLRRVAGLGDPKRSVPTPRTSGLKPVKKTTPTARQISGRELNDLWNVGAKHALYYKDGTWYNNLERFPGALFDPEGYVLFKTEQAYRNCQHLKIAKRTNVPGGIASIPGYVRMVA